MSCVIGMGEDSHRFSKKPKKLVLGGLIIPSSQGLLANSDGDVIFHSICNAFDIINQEGSLSNYADKICKKKKTKDSSFFIKHCLAKMVLGNWQINSLSVTLEAQKPLLENYREKIKESIAQNLKLKKEKIGLTFTSGEGLSRWGRGEGIRAITVLSFCKKH